MFKTLRGDEIQNKLPIDLINITYIVLNHMITVLQMKLLHLNVQSYVIKFLSSQNSKKLFVGSIIVSKPLKSSLKFLF